MMTCTVKEVVFWIWAFPCGF